MTMVPSPHALLQLKETSRQVGSDPLLKTKSYGHSFSLFASDTNCLISDLTTDHMDTEQDPLSTSKKDGPGTCSRSFDHEDNWLQLGLAGRLVPPQEPELTRPRNLEELDLLPAKTTGSTTPPSAHNIPGYPVHPPPLFLHPHGTAGFRFRQPEYFWNSRQMPYSSSTWNVQYSLSGNGVAAAKPGPSSSLMKIVNAPPRLNSGLWFVLQAEQNQIKELALPQLQKSYLRIKDRKMTILLIMKYLANKLHLESESEVEIRCRGQRVLPSQTVEHVRDAIWCKEQGLIREPPLSSLPFSRSPATDHLMILHYSRSSSSAYHT